MNVSRAEHCCGKGGAMMAPIEVTGVAGVVQPAGGKPLSNPEAHMTECQGFATNTGRTPAIHVLVCCCETAVLAYPDQEVPDWDANENEKVSGAIATFENHRKDAIAKDPQHDSRAGRYGEEQEHVWLISERSRFGLDAVAALAIAPDAGILIAHAFESGAKRHFEYRAEEPFIRTGSILTN
jgi:hypothetical protein